MKNRSEPLISIHDNKGSLNRDLGGLELFLASAGQLEAQESSVD